MKNSLYDSIKDFEAPVEENIPVVPEGVCTFSNNDSIIIAWDNSKGAKEYDIEKDGVIVASTNNSVYKDENLQYAEKHSYRVRAIRGDLLGNWSKIYFDKTLEAIEENKDGKDNIENKEKIASNELGKLKNKEDINSGVSLSSTENIEEDDSNEENSNIEEKNVLDGEENKLNEGKSEEELVEKVKKLQFLII